MFSVFLKRHITHLYKIYANEYHKHKRCLKIKLSSGIANTWNREICPNLQSVRVALIHQNLLNNDYRHIQSALSLPEPNKWIN